MGIGELIKGTCWCAVGKGTECCMLLIDVFVKVPIQI